MIIFTTLIANMIALHLVRSHRRSLVISQFLAVLHRTVSTALLALGQPSTQSGGFSIPSVKYVRSFSPLYNRRPRYLRYSSELLLTDRK